MLNKITSTSSTQKQESLIEEYAEIRNNSEHAQKFNKYRVRIKEVIDPSLNCVKYWTSSAFKVYPSGLVTIKTNINNLSRRKYRKIYSSLENIFECMLPHFEHVMGKVLHDRELEVIVSLQSLEIMPGETFQGWYHREGNPLEGIMAVGIFYYDKSDFDKDIFEISRKYRQNQNEILGNKIKIAVEKNDYIIYRNDKFLHRLGELRNLSDNIGHRKYVTFFVKNPDRYCAGLNSSECLVNVKEKYEILISIWSDDDILSLDIVELIILFIEDGNIFMQRKTRSIKKMHRLIDTSNDCEGVATDLRSEWSQIMTML